MTSPRHNMTMPLDASEGGSTFPTLRPGLLRALGGWPGTLSLAACLAVLYGGVLWKLGRDWRVDPDYTHGFIVPFFVAYVLWMKRGKLAEIPLQPSWAGVPLVVMGLLVLLTGVYGAELFLSRVSLLLLLAGLVWTFAGPAFLRTVAVPLLLLLLAVPFPAIIFNQLTFPLQLLASRLAATALPWMGVPVLREGNVLQLPAIQLEVAEACSGIRSLMTLLTVAVIYGYLVERSARRRWLLALASLPVAVAANAARIVGTGLFVEYGNPATALGFFHEFSGWLMFMVSLVLLYGLHEAMSRWPASQRGLA